MGKTIAETLQEATINLQAIGVPDARRDASVLISHVMGGDREIIFREPERVLTAEEQAEFSNCILRRENREPVSHIIGNREFWSRDFKVTRNVLDPRPDSETLIEAVLHHASEAGEPATILDLGTGSGCLALTLLAEFEGARGVAVDISQDALTVAKQNAEILGLSSRIEFVESNWFDNLSGTFNVIVSNPPYIEKDAIAALAPEVSRHEPILALDGGDDGLDCYRSIISQIMPFLATNGYVIFEVGQGQADAVKELMEAELFTCLKVHTDLAGIGRCVSGLIKK